MNLIIYMIIIPTVLFHSHMDVSACGYSGKLCCNNMYRNEGACVVCHVGYYRLRHEDDSFCRPCVIGYFGTNCTRVCDCQENHRCDKVFGCVCKVPGYNCIVLENGMHNRTSNGIKQYVVISMVTVPVFVVMVLSVILCRRLYYEYQTFNNQHQREETGMFTFIQRSLKGTRKTLKQHNTDDKNDEADIEDSNYCCIRESAMMATLPRGGYICDIPDDYNHLTTSIRVETTETYNLPIYTKMKDNKTKINTVWSPEYDTMNN